MPVTRMLLRMVAAHQALVPEDAKAVLVHNLRHAGLLVRDRGQGAAAPAAMTPGDVIELAFELADEPAVIEKLCALSGPEALDAALAVDVLAALDRFARA
jgi:hypothetical protein